MLAEGSFRVDHTTPLENRWGGWYVTGDIAAIDEDGFLWFVGRKDFLIQVGGSRVSPTEVEDSVYLSSLVRSAIAFGAADERQGQVVHLAVSLPEGSVVDGETLMRYCRKNLAPHMVPAVIHIWDGDLPSNGRGKLDRVRIVEICTMQGSLR